MRISELMTSPVVTVQPDTQLKDVAATLIDHGINAAPVTDASDRLVGIVSEADLLSLERPPGPGSVASWRSMPICAVLTPCSLTASLTVVSEKYQACLSSHRMLSVCSTLASLTS